MPDNSVLCSYCRKPVKLGKNTDAVDAFIYKYGELDEVPIWHRACAIKDGYKVGPEGHLVGYEPRGDFRDPLDESICTGCMGTGIYKHEGDATKYQCPYCKGSGQSPYPVKEEVERPTWTDDNRQSFRFGDYIITGTNKEHARIAFQAAVAYSPEGREEEYAKVKAGRWGVAGRPVRIKRVVKEAAANFDDLRQTFHGTLGKRITGYEAAQLWDRIVDRALRSILKANPNKKSIDMHDRIMARAVRFATQYIAAHPEHAKQLQYHIDQQKKAGIVSEDVAQGKAQTSGQFATAGFPQSEGVQRKSGQFIVTDRKGKPVGKPYPSYSAAQKADNARPKYEDIGGICREMSDTAPAVSKLESFGDYTMEKKES